jgi:DNA/RNA-binding domain of Phe-tRNA-synthetase-like protein
MGVQVDIRLSPSVSGRLRLGYVVLEDVRVRPPDLALHAEIEALGARMRELYSGREPSAIPELQLARRLYRALGMDPTRTRPASEALLRRLLKGEALYRINTVVDAGNLFSLEFLLPIGLYAADRIEGAVLADIAGEGEGYDGIRKDWVHLGGRVALRDARGWFGNPSSDSLRTSIRDSTRSVLLTVFVPGDHPDADLDRALDRAEGLQRQWSGGKRGARGVLS